MKLQMPIAIIKQTAQRTLMRGLPDPVILGRPCPVELAKQSKNTTLISFKVPVFFLVSEDFFK